MLRHVLSARQFNRADLDQLFAAVTALAAQPGGGPGCGSLQGRIMASLFYEPSTRTRLSFEAAMLRLGGQVITTENAREFSSAIKGESLEDTIRVISGYADVVVLRHFPEGAAAAAAAVATVPIINAGDGPGEHPTQALLDLYTIHKECGTIDGLTVALVGDLAYGRTVHSLAYMLSIYKDVELLLVSPPGVPMPTAVLQFLDRQGVRFEAVDDLKAAAARARVVYQTRIQRERFPSASAFAEAYGRFKIDAEIMDALAPEAIVLHPLPRSGEIDPGVDDDPRAAYFRQAHNGVYVRMALLQSCLGGPAATQHCGRPKTKVGPTRRSAQD